MAHVSPELISEQKVQADVLFESMRFRGREFDNRRVAGNMSLVACDRESIGAAAVRARTARASRKAADSGAAPGTGRTPRGKSISTREAGVMTQETGGIVPACGVGCPPSRGVAGVESL